MNFRTQALKDLKVFHNPNEFGDAMTIYYEGHMATVNAVLDDDTELDRNPQAGDFAPGINRSRATLYLSQMDLGFVPQRGGMISIEQSGSYKEYQVAKSTVQDGEIVLTLEYYCE